VRGDYHAAGRQHVAGGRPGSERAARHERSSERGRGAAGSPDPTTQLARALRHQTRTRNRAFVLLRKRIVNLSQRKFV
jgi:hypothetical protein